MRRFVHASSSSVYGGATTLPTPESELLVPRSPYAVTKLAAEHYCRVFAELYGLETVALRYFNVYGPRQRPDATYAAVIPLFVDALLHGRDPEVHGDGLQSRDFTYISDVVAANLAAAAAPAAASLGARVQHRAGLAASLLDILRVLGELLGVTPTPQFVAAPRRRREAQPRRRERGGARSRLPLHGRSRRRAPAHRRVVAHGHLTERRP